MLSHHLDSNVVIGVFIYRDEQAQRACTAYCDLIGHRYGGSISLIALGEVTKVFSQQSKDKATRDLAMLYLGDLLFKQNVRIQMLSGEDLQLAAELHGLNRACDWPELISLAVCIWDKAQVFMTLDETMHQERFRSEIKKRYKVAIQRPALD